MAALTVQSLVAAGLVPTTVSAGGSGDTVSLGPTDDRVFLMVTNGGGSSITVTLTDPGTTPAGNAGTSGTATVAAAATKLIPISPALVNTSTGAVSISYSATTSVTVAAVRR